MIAIRRCRRCGKSFDACVETDTNIYCEDCREIVALILDTTSTETDLPDHLTDDCSEEQSLTPFEEVPDNLLEAVQSNLQKYKESHPQSNVAQRSSKQPVRRAQTARSSKDIYDPYKLDEETLKFLDSLDAALL